MQGARAGGAIGALLIVAALMAFSSAACRESVALGGFDQEPDGGSLNIGGDGGASEVDANAFAPLCASPTCPAPYGTCSDDTFRCETNFDSDNANCGACGVVCPSGEKTRAVFGAEWFCQSAQCKMACSADTVKHTGDCNSDVGDGCEVNLDCDPNHCGSCGNKCPAGTPCVVGSCGCPAGLTTCGTGESCGAECTSLVDDDWNCGGCGKACPFDNPSPTPPGMRWGCRESQCDRLKCDGAFKDCNDDEGDGCEIDVSVDVENCGACGKKCGPGQFCQDATCQCKPNETLCVDSWGSEQCANLDEDRQNCGACGNECPFIELPSKSVCRLGRCEIECAAGHADCDGQVSNGCETFIAADPRNCGGCGVQCDLAIGQPCVNSACNVVPCPEGPPK